MGRTRAFGSLVYKPNKQTPARIVASFNTPDCAWHDHRNRSTEDPDSKIGTPKTSRSVRDERIPSQLVPLLDHFLKRYIPNTPTACLFSAAHNPQDPIHPNGLRGMYAKARTTVGRDDLRFHDSRHTGLTWMALDGATVRELMDSAGHADADTAMRYQHAIDERYTVLAEKLGERLLPDETPETIQTQISMIQQDIEALQRKREGLERRMRELRAAGCAHGPSDAL